jgi:putative ABC transport system permease protein
MSFLSALTTDASRGARSLLRSPGLALAGSLTLALGIGAATALFSVVNAVLVRPLPHDRPETRVMIWSRWTGFDKTWVSEHEVFDYRELPAFREVAAWSTDQANLTGDGDPVRVGVAPVTVNAFRTLGAEPLLGRPFRPEEEKTGADTVVIVSYRLWQGRYGGDPALVGRRIPIDRRSHEVVGIMPRGFRLPTDYGEDASEPTELWVPLYLDPSSECGNHGLYAAAELSPTSGPSGPRNFIGFSTGASRRCRSSIGRRPTRPCLPTRLLGTCCSSSVTLRANTLQPRERGARPRRVSGQVGARREGL